MSKWMRRIRGGIGIGLLWGTAWFGAGMVLLLIVGLDAADVPFPLFFGLLGFIAGLAFSGILGAVERRRSFDQMSIPRFAALGGVGGFLLSLVLTLIVGGGALPLLGPIFAGAGAACAAGTLALARKADDRRSLESGIDVDAVGLTPEEKRELLGDGN